jgi:hypothetical protein
MSLSGKEGKDKLKKKKVKIKQIKRQKIKAYLHAWVPNIPCIIKRLVITKSIKGYSHLKNTLNI